MEMKIVARNQGYIEEASVEFIKGLNVLRGKSSQGKSTLVRAIEATVFNMNSDYLISYGKTSSEVSITYGGHEIRRVRDTKAKENKTTYFIDGEKYVKNGRNALDEVQNAIGIREIEVSGDKIHMAFSSAFGKPFLVDESPQKVFDFLTYSSSERSLSDVVQRIKDDISSEKENCRSLESTVNSIKLLLQESEKRVSIFDGIDESEAEAVSLKKKSDGIMALSESVETASERLREIDSLASISEMAIPEGIDFDVDAFTGLSENISKAEDIRKKIDSDMELLKSIEQAISAFPSESISEEIKIGAERHEGISNLLASLQDTLKRGKASSGFMKNSESIFSFDIESLCGAVENLQKMDSLIRTLDMEKIQCLSASKKKLNEDIMEAEKEFSEFHTCPLCGSEIHEDSHLSKYIDGHLQASSITGDVHNHGLATDNA